ncbi:MAG: nicotinate phosphoribosyltransferase [Methylococcaceae bacterium]|nr:nicotinate phosphoribosyltransferase [Methylococcaceae bacterium]
MIQSILDNDLYKLTMQQAVLAAAPDAEVVYKFKNRRPEKQVNKAMFSGIQQDIEQLAKLKMDAVEHDWLAKECAFFNPAYLEYLANYRFNPDELILDHNDNELSLTIKGLWHSTIMWEVPLMAIISRNHFLHSDKSWNKKKTPEKQEAKALQKAKNLSDAGCLWADFGTRRRRNYESQNRIVETHKNYKGFVGTSNVHLACKHGVKPIGTMAHEWIMAGSVLWSLRHANRYALAEWGKIYHGQLGIALTDTFGTPAFFNDFDQQLAREYDGVRHDSADPFTFADQVIQYYRSLGIDPASKSIVFSDSLNTELAIELQQFCHGRIKCSFGIGTHFSNDYEGSPALNIVIKISEINGVPVVKLSDDEGKATGDKNAVRVAKWTFGLGGLDE